MIEIKIGIFNLLKKVIGGSSLQLAVVYTIGHILIAMTCNRMITGADWALAGADALIEPIINGFWFYILHKGYKVYSSKQK